MPEKVKGKEDRVSLYQEEITDDASLISSYFGFKCISYPTISKKDTAKYKQTMRSNPLFEEKVFDLRERIALLRSFEEWEMAKLPPPYVLSWRRPLPEEGSRKIGDDLSLDVFGLSGSAAEALLLRTTVSVLEEAGFENLLIELNCIGDKESFAEFEKHIGAYVRKNINVMPASVRKAVKKDVFSIYQGGSKDAEELAEQAPKSLSFLGESMRTYFKEVLEYTESFGVPYILNHRLIGIPGITTGSVFQIRDGDSKESAIIAQGMRYSKLSKKAGFKKELPSVGVSISWKKSFDSKRKIKKLPKYKFYLVQLGFEAKLRSLNIIESLRRGKISVAHSLSKDKLGSQLSQAENMRVPYVIIVGHKEALDGVVVVRDMNTRVQEVVPIHELAQYIKKLK